MKAVTQTKYGTPSVLTITNVETPSFAKGEVLVEVFAAPVTQGDRRLRAADFPGISALLGRLVTGLTRPRHTVPGTAFAGRVCAVGSEVTRFAVGDRVFGACMHSAHAEFISVPADSGMALIPDGVGFEEAAALPYGGATALIFHRDIAETRAGDRVLIVGASGGVGLYAVQVAKARGAHVTAVATRGHDQLRALGADHIIPRDVLRTWDGEPFDVVLDTSGQRSYGETRQLLTDSGRFVTLHISLSVLFWGLWTTMVGGPKAKMGVSFGNASDFDELASIVAEGDLKPVLADDRFELTAVAEAHSHLEQTRPIGTVVVSVAAPGSVGATVSEQR